MTLSATYVKIKDAHFIKLIVMPKNLLYFV